MMAGWFEVAKKFDRKSIGDVRLDEPVYRQLAEIAAVGNRTIGDQAEMLLARAVAATVEDPAYQEAKAARSAGGSEGDTATVPKQRGGRRPKAQALSATEG